MQYLFKEMYNPIRDSVTEAWAPIHDIDGKECIREEPLLTIDDVSRSVISEAYPLVEWENKKQRSLSCCFVRVNPFYG